MGSKKSPEPYKSEKTGKNKHSYFLDAVSFYCFDHSYLQYLEFPLPFVILLEIFAAGIKALYSSVIKAKLHKAM